MKYPLPLLLSLTVLSLIFACSSPLEDSFPREDELENETKELKLSIPGEENGQLEIDDVDVEFEILDGNGEYVASVSHTDGDEDAKVTITGNKVKVNLLTRGGAEITITDKELQEASVWIISTHESLQVPSYGLLLSEGQTYIMKDLKFGAGGPYTIENVKGNASEASIENDNVKVTSHKLGNTYYKVRDKRGTIAKLEVSTTLQVDLNTNYLELEGHNTMSLTVNLPKGKDWVIVSSTDKVTNKVHLNRPFDPIKGSIVDYDVLFIDTADEGKGTDTITLRANDGELAVVRLWVR